MKQYADTDGNTYRPERATNGAWVVMRINAGGNRKRLKDVGIRSTEEQMQKVLDLAAEARKWRRL